MRPVWFDCRRFTPLRCDLLGSDLRCDLMGSDPLLTVVEAKNVWAFSFDCRHEGV